MNAKKTLQNRIRGWFPKEPNPKPIQQYVRSAPINQKNLNTDIDAIKQRTFFLIFLPLTVLLSLLYISSTFRDAHVSWQVGAIGMISGLVTGSLIGLPFTMRELKLLSEEGEIRNSVRLWLLTLLLIVVFAGISLFLILYFSFQIEVIYLDLSLGITIGSYTSNAILCFRWENTFKKRIYRRMWGGMYAIPQNQQAHVSTLINAQSESKT
jgi:hypothetical protein